MPMSECPGGMRMPSTPSGVAAHRADVVLVEADGLAFGGHQDEVVVPRGVPHRHQLVVVGEVDGDDPVGLQRGGVVEEAGLLDDALFGGEHQVLGVGVVLGGDDRLDLLALSQRQEVGHVATLALSAAQRQLVHFYPVDLAA